LYRLKRGPPAIADPCEPDADHEEHERGAVARQHQHEDLRDARTIEAELAAPTHRDDELLDARVRDRDGRAGGERQRSEIRDSEGRRRRSWETGRGCVRTATGRRAMTAGSTASAITCETHETRRPVFQASTRGNSATSPAPPSSPIIAANSTALRATDSRPPAYAWRMAVSPPSMLSA
jgi:hypothetical protein